MPVILAADAPRFNLAGAPQTVFTGLAAPSRGASETSVWRVALGPGTPASPHVLDHEEILVCLAGQAQAHLAADEFTIHTGDAIIVPAGTPFSLATPLAERFEAVAVLPVGARASMANGEWFMPPWTV